MPPVALDRLADEVDLLELDAETVLIAADRLAGRTPRGVRRALYDHEHDAHVNFADLETAVDARAETVARRLAEDRAQFAALLRADLEASIAAAGHLPADRAIAGRLEALLDPARYADPVAGAAQLVADAERFHADELAGAVRDGIDRAVAEAQRQGIPAAHLPAIPPAAQARLDVAARRLASAPHADIVKAAADAAYQTAGTGLAGGAVLDRVDQAVADLSPARLAGYARPAVQQAHNLGHQETAATIPRVARIYASELLDRNTCGPCSLIDGHEYPDEESALVDYPAGTYIDCEGGDQCRGTLVYVWTDEETPTAPSPGDQPAPPTPPDPYPLGTSRPLPPRQPPPAAIGDLAPPSPPPAAPGVPERPIPPNPASPPAGAAADTLADLLPAVPVEAAATPAEVAAARRNLDRARAEVRNLARAAQDDARAALDVVDALKLDQPPKRTVLHRDLVRGTVERRAEHSGEWDWFYGLDEREQVRIRRNWVYRDAESHGHAPDEIAQRWAAAYGETSTDQAMNEWVELNRRIDANGALARGRLPNEQLYGGLDANSLIDTPYDLRVLFGNDLDAAAAHVAGVAADLETRYAERAFAPARLGPAPYTMTQEEFAAELADIEEAAANVAPVDEWGDYDPAAQRTLDRLNELVPYGLDDPADPMPVEELYQAMMRLARRAGLAE